MSKAPTNSNAGESLDQAAIRCYLTTLLAATDCMVQTCPDVGMTFKRRWARAPQRIGFEPSVKTLETSRREFESDLRAFAEYAGAYFRPSVPIIENIAGQGSLVADSVLDKVAAHSVLLETIGESLATIADMEAPPSIREALEHHSEGLLRSARVAERELLPLVSQLRELVQHCQEIVANSRKVYLVDVDTGLLNRDGFKKEIARRIDDKTLQCLISLHVKPIGLGGRECTNEEFRSILQSLSPSVFEQFRASESIGCWERQLAIIFGGTVEQAQSRKADIERRLSGDYSIGESRVRVKIQMEVFGTEGATEFTDFVDEPQEVVTQLG